MLKRDTASSDSQATTMRHRGSDVVLSIALVAMLAASWLLAGHLVARVPPLVVAAGRTAGSFLVLTAIALSRWQERTQMRLVLGRGRTILLLGFLGFFAYYAGTMLGTGLIGASRVGLITSLLPSMTFAIGMVAFGEPATRGKVLGTMLALSGAVGYVLVDGQGSGPGVRPFDGATIAGGLLALGGTFAYAVYGYLYQKHLSDLPTMAALPAVSGAGAIMLTILAISSARLSGLALADLAELAVLGVALTAPVFILLHELIRRRGPLFTAALSLAVPFLIRTGEWALASKGPPSALVLLFLLVCCAGVGLTLAGGPRRIRRLV
ncbi:EamA family transporter [Qipengyuania citrea]|uniref:DMT family transporter n=1 Tax=Qipengyuania citrea TaxID=225971 RepID=UPI001E560267|nr:DMT family transporter [Qipengyuania citrea]MCD1591063.1 EamA family transporter [Qipengyuania citrea]